MKIMITVKTMQEMGRLCYELGSRHISAEISENIVKCPFDEGWDSMRKKRKKIIPKIFHIQKYIRKFTDSPFQTHKDIR